jgi:hypothetical protein
MLEKLIRIGPWTILGFIILGFFLSSVILGYMGISTPVGESSYTGVIVDVEHNRGYIFRTTQVYMKTDATASAVETFCVKADSQPELFESVKKNYQDGEKVTVDYDRPIWVSPFKCQSGHSVINSVNPVN